VYLWPGAGKIRKQFEITTAIQLHKGMIDDTNPLAFDGSALSDFLVNQVLATK
jgi:hypothetical protein